jgi:hypothetical protein
MDEHDGGGEIGELYVSDLQPRQLRDRKGQSENLATKIKISPRRDEEERDRKTVRHPPQRPVRVSSIQSRENSDRGPRMRTELLAVSRAQMMLTILFVFFAPLKGILN